MVVCDTSAAVCAKSAFGLLVVLSIHETPSDVLRFTCLNTLEITLGAKR